MTRRPADSLELLKRILRDDYLELGLLHLRVEEDFEEQKNGDQTEVASDGSCTVTVETVDTHGVHHKVDGKGCGMIEALFNGLLGRYAVEYQSLQSIRLIDFEVKANMETRSGKTGADARGTVTVVVENSEGRRFPFSDHSRSVVSSTARAVVAAVEYFVNSERAFITLHKSLVDAQQRNRSDLVTRYTAELAEIVKSTSYASVIERIKKEIP